MYVKVKVQITLSSIIEIYQQNTTKQAPKDFIINLHNFMSLWCRTRNTLVLIHMCIIQNTTNKQQNYFKTNITLILIDIQYIIRHVLFIMISVLIYFINYLPYTQHNMYILILVYLFIYIIYYICRSRTIKLSNYFDYNFCVDIIDENLIKHTHVVHGIIVIDINSIVFYSFRFIQVLISVYV